MNWPRSINKPLIHSATHHAIIIFLLLTCGHNSQAAMAPSTGKKWQQKAPEKVSMIVLESHSRIVEKKKFFANDIEVSAKVKIVSVDRTKSNLKKGQVIDVLYTSMSALNPPPGDWPSVVVTGKYYVAYLKLKEGDNSYSPAASSYSFIPWNAEQFRAHRNK